MSKKLPRERLKALRERSGLSGIELAKVLGYKSAPGYYAYEQERTQRDKPIPYDVIKRLMPVLRGKGTPPITSEDLMDLTASSDRPKDRHDVISIVEKQIQRELIGTNHFVPVRLRIESGTYMDSKQPVKLLGPSRIGYSPEYTQDSQFVALLSYAHGEFDAGTQLHCATLSEFSVQSAVARTHVVSIRFDGTPLVSYAVVDGRNVTSDMQTVGVIIGRYNSL
jgi:transcriptional regulator with XRE-family HTH domain